MSTPPASSPTARRRVRTSTPSAPRSRSARRESSSGQPSSSARPGLEQRDPRGRGVDRAVVGAQRCPRESSAICPASSMPVGPPPTTAKRSHASRSAALGRQLRLLERAQDPAADLARVGERLQPGRHVRPLVAAEVAVRRAGRHDQRVVAERDRLAVRGERVRLAGVEVEAGDVGEQHARVGLAAEDAAQRRGDLALGEDAGRHLVEQRLEQVVVRPVDERDLDGRAAERLGGVQAAEAAADDQDPVRGSLSLRGSSSHLRLVWGEGGRTRRICTGALDKVFEKRAARA